MSLLRGMKDGAAERIENARAVRPFDSVKALARRAQLDRKDRHVLADANAPASLAGNRSEALWQSVVAVPDKAMPAVVAVGTRPLSLVHQGGSRLRRRLSVGWSRARSTSA